MPQRGQRGLAGVRGTQRRSDGSVADLFCLGPLGRALTRALGDDRSARPCNGTCTTESSVQ
jgi:hypothetical protein